MTMVVGMPGQMPAQPGQMPPPQQQFVRSGPPPMQAQQGAAAWGRDPPPPAGNAWAGGTVSLLQMQQQHSRQPGPPPQTVAQPQMPPPHGAPLQQPQPGQQLQQPPPPQQQQQQQQQQFVMQQQHQQLMKQQVQAQQQQQAQVQQQQQGLQPQPQVAAMPGQGQPEAGLAAGSGAMWGASPWGAPAGAGTAPAGQNRPPAGAWSTPGEVGRTSIPQQGVWGGSAPAVPAPQHVAQEAPRAPPQVGVQGSAGNLSWAGNLSQPRNGQQQPQQTPSENAGGIQGPWGNSSSPAQALFLGAANGNGALQSQNYAAAAGGSPPEKPAGAPPLKPAAQDSEDWREYTTPDTGE